MIHDSGMAVIYQVTRDEAVPPPVPVRLTEKTHQLFADRTVGTTRFYQAAQVGRRVDRLIEIWRDDSITTQDICKISDEYYLVVQTASGEDEDGIHVTRLSLERSDGVVWELPEEPTENPTEKIPEEDPEEVPEDGDED